MLIPREAVQKLKKLHDLLVTEVAHSWSATEIENRKALMMVLEKKNNDNNRETAEDWKYLQWKSILMENYCRPKAREVDSTFNFSSLLSWYDESPPEQASTNSEKLVLQALKNRNLPKSLSLLMEFFVQIFHLFPPSLDWKSIPLPKSCPMLITLITSTHLNYQPCTSGKRISVKV